MVFNVIVRPPNQTVLFFGGNEINFDILRLDQLSETKRPVRTEQRFENN